MSRHLISVSDEVFRELQKYARGFEKPDYALRRVLGLPFPKLSDHLDLQILKTDPDLEEIAEELAEELEGKLGMGPFGEYSDRLEDRIISLFGDEFREVVEENPMDVEENLQRFERYTALMTLAAEAVLELLAESLNAAYKQPTREGGEEDGEAGEDAGRESDPSHQ